MDRWICSIGELLQQKRIGEILCQLPRPADGALHSLTAWSELQLSAIGTQHGAALLAHGVGHDQDQAVTPGRRDHGQGNAGVAARGLHQDRALRCDPPSSFRVADHRDTDAVFDRSGGIETFQLGDDLSTAALVMGQAVEAHQWGSAHELCDVRGNRH